MSPEASSRSEQLLARIRSERGYALSYHELLARTDPAMLAAYRELYAEFTLVPRHLDTRRRELVWTGLLAAIDEHIGSLHLERALEAGVSPADLRGAVRLGGIAAAWDAVAFAADHWSHLLGDVPATEEYRMLVEGAQGPLGEVDAHLVLSAVSGARTNQAQFVFHLQELSRLGVPEEQVAEAVSYLLLPTGANTFLWATDTWFDAVRHGQLKAGDILRDVSFDIRRS